MSATPSRELTAFLARLDNVRRGGSGFTARCPAHDDHDNSLGVRLGDQGQVLVHCFTGCETGAVVAALGLTMGDLFPKAAGRGGRYPSRNAATVQHHRTRGENPMPAQPQPTPPASGCTLAAYAEAKQLPQDFLQSIGLSNISHGGSPALRIPYTTPEGDTGPVRIRKALAKSPSGDNRFAWKVGTKPTLYGLDRVKAIKEKRRVLLVEGESDCHTAWYHGVYALGLPGANNWREERDAEHFDGVDRINVIIEPDSGGEAVRAWLAKSRIRDRVHLVTLGEYKDLSALHLAYPDDAAFKERLLGYLKAATKWADQEQAEAEEAQREAWTRCADLAMQPDILGGFAEAQRARGVVGEVRTMKLVYLAATSRLLARPISVAIKGPSSGGKSYTTERTLDFFPPSAFYALSAMSERALVYSEEPLKHRMLVIYEAAGMTGDMATYLIRSLLSEGHLRYETVVKSEDGLRGQLIEREGPTGLIVTTTALHLHPENETRLLSITVTDTPEQTRAIFRALAKEESVPFDLAPWLALQEWLTGAEHRVTIPFSDRLADSMDAAAVRLRRDFGMVLNLIRTHAILHQATRERDATGQIIATLTDYAAIRDLVADLVAAGVELTTPATVRETVAAVAQAQRDAMGPVPLQQIARVLNLDKSVASRRVKDAIDRGFLRNEETRKGRSMQLILGEPLPGDAEVLPTVEQLTGCCTVAEPQEGTAPLPLPARGVPAPGTNSTDTDEEIIEWTA